MGVWLAAIAAVLLSSATAGAEAHVHREAGLQFELPDGWTTKIDGDTLEAEGPEGLPTLQFDVISDDEVDDYLEGWAEGAGEAFEDIEVTTDGRVETIHGLRHVFSEGTATVDGVALQWDLTIVQGGRKTLAIIAFGPDLDDKVMTAIYNSIRKAP